MPNMNAAVQQGDVQAAVQAGMELSLGKVINNPNPETTAMIVVPEGTQLLPVPRQEKPTRLSGIAKMHDADSFIAFWSKFRTDASNIYAMVKPTVGFVAVFDDNVNGAADWRAFRCSYVPAYSPEWEAWAKQNKLPFDGNQDLAEWLEDNGTDIITPDAATMLDIALNIKVHQEQGFSNRVNLSNGKVNLVYDNDVSASATNDAGQNLSIPEEFKIRIPVFEGIQAKGYDIMARFRYRLMGAKLKLRYELVRPHKVVELAYIELLEKIKDATGATILFGAPTI